MRLQDDIDFTTLTWVKGELDETLKQARQALEAYVEDPTDVSQMRFCATYLHQVQGTLRMVELYGAAMVTEEMERVADDLMHDRIAGRDEAYTVLMRGIVQLPDYLERLQSGHKDIPIVLLPLLNDLRASRGEKGLSESVLFTPDLSRPLPGSAKGPGKPVEPATLARMAEQLRLQFQLSLLKWFKNEDPATHVARLAVVCDKLVTLIDDEAARRLFWISAGLLNALRERAFDPPAPLKQAFGKVEREIKRLVDHGEASIRVDPPRELTRTLLYFAAHAPTQHGRISELRQTFELDRLLPSEEEIRHAQGSISGHNRALLDTVSAAIKEDLLRVKDALDLHLRTQSDDLSSLAAQAEVLGRVADTLGMLGLGVPRGVVLEQRQAVEEVAQGKRPADESTLLDIAGALLYVESSLDDQVQHLGSGGGIRDASMADSRKVLDALIKEAQANFAQAKQCFVAFVESNWDHTQLQDVPRLLGEVGGALRILELDEPPRYLAAIGRFTEVELLARRRVPNGQQLDTLADALAGLEYYLEALREHRAGREKILDVARQRLEALGYWPIPEDGLQGVVDGVPVATDPVQRDAEIEQAVEQAPLDAEESATQAAPAVAGGLEPEAGAAGDPAAPAPTPAAPARPVPAAPIAPPQGFELAGEDIDEEIREVFIEEVQEEINNLGELFPVWKANPDAAEQLKPIRRVFHTLKGSGRLVGALTLGEFSWKIENMLNRVLDQSIRPDAGVIAVIAAAHQALPGLLDALKGEGLVRHNLEGIKQAAERISAGEMLAADEVMAAASLQPAQVDAADTAGIGAELPGLDIEAPAVEAATDLADGFEDELAGLGELDQGRTEAERTEADGSIEVVTDASGEAVSEVDLSGLVDDDTLAALDSPLDSPSDVTDDGLDVLSAELERELADAERALDGPAADASLTEFVGDDALAGIELEEIDEAAAEAEWAAELAAEEASGQQAPGLYDGVGGHGSLFSIDAVLFDILKAEVAGHLETVDDYIGSSRAQPEPVNDPLLRAVHTMSGAFAMTEVPHITDVVSPLEGYIKRLIAQRAAPSREGVELIEQAADAIRQLMHTLEQEPPYAPAFHTLADRLQTLRDTLPEPTGPLFPVLDDAEGEAVDHPALEEIESSPVEQTWPEAEFATPADAGSAESPASEIDQGWPLPGGADPFAESVAPDSEQAPQAIPAGQDAGFGVEDLEGVESSENIESVEPPIEALAGEASEGELPGAEALPAAEPDAEQPAFEELEFEDLIAEPPAAPVDIPESIEDGFEIVEGEFDEALIAEEPDPSAVVPLAEHENEDDAALVALLLADAPAPADGEQPDDADAAATGSGPADPPIAADVQEEHGAESGAIDAEAPDSAVEAPAGSDAEVLEPEAVDAEDAQSEEVAADAIEAAAIEPDAPAAEEITAETVEPELVDAEEVDAEAFDADALDADEAQVEAPAAGPLEPVASESDTAAPDAVTAEAVESERVETEEIDADVPDTAAFAVDAVDDAGAQVEAEAEAEAEAAEAEAAQADARAARAAAGSAQAASSALAAALADADPDPDAPLVLPDMDEELLDIFLEEGIDILDHSDGLLATLRENPADRELVVGLQRDLHTLKGGARMAGLLPIGDLGHSAESLLEAVADGRRDLGGAGMEVLERVFDRLHGMVIRVGERKALAMPQTLLGYVDTLVRGEKLEFATEDASQGLAEPVAATVATESTAEQPTAVRPTALDTAFDEDESLARAPQEQIRIRADLLDRLVNYAGEVAIYRARLEQQVGAFKGGLVEMEATTNRLREQLRRLEIETEAQIIARYQREQDEGEATNFDPLELDRFSTLQQLSRALAESAADLTNLQGTLEDLTRQYETLLLQQSRVSSELQEGLMRTRMVPFDALVPRLRRILRQTASELGKKAQLKVEGAQGEMDRNVLDRMTAPLEHMLRNALAHGLESPEDREGAGKPAEGTVRIHVSREASEVVIRVADDGRGMDRNAIRRKAIERGLLDPDAQISDRELFGFVLASGFSTAQSVSKIAGRGVGMDVVHSEIKQLGGSLYIESEFGRGSEFVVRLPFTLAVTQAVFVKLGETSYAIPITSVQGVARIAPDLLQAKLSEGDPSFEYAGERYAIHDLGLLLGHGQVRATESLQVPLLLARSGDLRAAICIDQVIGSREIVVKPTGPQVNSIPGIFGATVMGDGSVVIILDVAPLVRRAAALHAIGETPTQSAPVVQRAIPLVMVVDDSITMRKVSGRVLERAGYEVMTAKDGVDAIEKMQERVPDAMLLDIEMPRMDGYELATHMRNDIRLRGVPIIMITSRTGEKHRQRAFEIGVDRYLGKPYQEAELMRNVQELLKVGRGSTA